MAAAQTRTALDAPRIVAAALDLVDRDGLVALSMRKLGALLGVEAMALYHYFPSKAVLVDALAGEVLSRLEVPPANTEGDWTTVVRQVAESFRNLGRTHPNIFPLLATIGLDNPASLEPAEAILSVLSVAGLGPRAAFDAFITLKSYVVGYVLWEIGNHVHDADSSAMCVVGDLGPLAEPHLASIADWLAERRIDSQFEAGLSLMIDGIRWQLSTSAADPGRVD